MTGRPEAMDSSAAMPIMAAAVGSFDLVEGHFVERDVLAVGAGDDADDVPPRVSAGWPCRFMATGFP